MNKPVNNRDAFALVISIVGTKTNLANHLGVAKQLVSRWDEIPPNYLAETSKITGLTVDYILPELDAKVSALIGKRAAPFLAPLIRLLCPERRH